MVVTTHQPIFLPWPGFFYKALHADALVLLDRAQFPQGRGWLHRNRLTHQVAETSRALDLESGVFTWPSPRAIARSLKRSAGLSTRRKAGAYQSAVSMLNFYINRAGRDPSPKRRRILERAESEWRITFGRG